MDQFEIDRQAFEKAARSYNYYSNIYQERIVNAPSTYAQERIDIFNDLHDINKQAYIALRSNIRSTLSFLDEATIAWEYIRQQKDAYINYVNDTALNKTDLASLFISNSFDAHISTLEQFFSEVSTRSFDAITKLQHFIYSFNDLWMNMVEEITLIPYYQAIHADVMNASSQSNAELLEVYAEYLEQSEDWILAHWNELNIYLNADFASRTNHSITLVEFEEELLPLEEYLDVTDIIGQLDESFFATVTEIQNTMRKFVNGHEIGDAFYK